MTVELNRKDRELLEWLAEYRMLTTSQIAVLCAIGAPAARKRVKKLRQAGLALPLTRLLTGSAGRPEELTSLTSRGVAGLRVQGRDNRSVPTKHVTSEAINCVEHQNLINWFRIHLVQMERALPDLTVQFLASTSLLLERGSDNQPYVSEALGGADGEQRVAFAPDGVFSIRHKPSDKTLLFFLEVDRGTETLASTRNPGSVQQKIINYQQYFRSGGYKRYQDLWNCEFNGFRLLFLAHSPGRLAALCRLVQETPPSDFVWLTDRDRMFAEGMSADIWARGGKLDAPLESIVGRSRCGR
jgi:hypothetical protein